MEDVVKVLTVLPRCEPGGGGGDVHQVLLVVHQLQRLHRGEGDGGARTVPQLYPVLEEQGRKVDIAESWRTLNLSL